MDTLYQFTIFANLALMAMIVAIYVLASSFHGSASRLAAEEEEDYLSKRKEKLDRIVNELTAKLDEKTSSPINLGDIRSRLEFGRKELSEIDKSINRARRKGTALSVNKMVVVPFILLLVSVATSAIAILTAGDTPSIVWSLPGVDTPILMWGIALLFTFTSLIWIYNKLRIIDTYAKERNPWLPPSRLAPPVMRAENFVVSDNVTESEPYDLHSDIEDVLASLSDRESRLIRMIFGIGEQQVEKVNEIARRLEISPSTVRRSTAIAIRKSRHPSRSRRLKKYLDDIPIEGTLSGEQRFLRGIFGE